MNDNSYQFLLYFLTLCLPRICFAIITIRQYYLLYVEYYDDTKCKNQLDDPLKYVCTVAEKYNKAAVKHLRAMLKNFINMRLYTLFLFVFLNLLFMWFVAHYISDGKLYAYDAYCQFSFNDSDCYKVYISVHVSLIVLSIAIEMLLIKSLVRRAGVKARFDTKVVRVIDNKLINKAVTKKETITQRKMSIIDNRHRKSVEFHKSLVLDQGKAPDPLIYKPVHNKDELQEIMATNKIEKLNAVIMEAKKNKQAQEV